MHNQENKGRIISLQRAEKLKSYSETNSSITKGTDETSISSYESQKAKLLNILGAGEEQWNDWRWQVDHRIDNSCDLAKMLELSIEEKEEIQKIGETYRFAVTPYYLALIDPGNPLDAIKAMCLPTSLEMNEEGEADPMAEEFTNPAGVVTRRYPDRVIINVTNACAMFCRHCQRRRRIGGNDLESGTALLDESIDYIRSNPEIREVLVTGGDALMLDDEQLEYIFSSLRAIPSVEVIRIGSRTLVTLPMRITDSLLEMMKKYHPLYLNTHFNHPRELTPQAIDACSKLSNAGVPLGNQMVLLKGVNDHKHIVQILNQELLKARVRPYYIFHAKNVVGTTHFCTSIDKGLEIMEYLRGRTTGMGMPTYVLNAPNGLGKIPLVPEYIVKRTPEKVILRTWEGELVEYPNAVEENKKV
jgi:lysine 2,3-aminomutase